MRLIDVSHTIVNIASRIETVIDEFGLTDKTFSITIDNASTNFKAWTFLGLSFLDMLTLCSCIKDVHVILLI
jgi:hypothetical protein